MRHCFNRIFGRCSRIEVLRMDFKTDLNRELIDNIVETVGVLEVAKIEADQLNTFTRNNAWVDFRKKLI